MKTALTLINLFNATTAILCAIAGNLPCACCCAMLAGVTGNALVDVVCPDEE